MSPCTTVYRVIVVFMQSGRVKEAFHLRLGGLLFVHPCASSSTATLPTEIWGGIGFAAALSKGTRSEAAGDRSGGCW